MAEDLGRCAGASVAIELYTLEQFAAKRGTAVALGRCIDSCDLNSVSYSPEVAPKLRRGGAPESAVWVSHLLKSNCPVTGQPDWASIWVGLEGEPCDPQALLQYIVSFREHQDFHENCVERIYADLFDALTPSRLWVYARYTRRGGLDINPFRASHPMTPPNIFGVRQ